MGCCFNDIADVVESVFQNVNSKFESKTSNTPKDIRVLEVVRIDILWAVCRWEKTEYARNFLSYVCTRLIEKKKGMYKKHSGERQAIISIVSILYFEAM